MIPEILFFDTNLLVINKPAGVPVLPDGWEKDSPYLVKMLESEFGKLWVVHRLDKTTSGVILFARTAEAHRELNLQFEQHAAQKIYHAIVVGIPPWEEHTARHPLRINVGHTHRTVVDHSKGKPSETTFRVLEKLSGYSLLEAAPGSGRTHQIRVHIYALGYPLLGETLYGDPATGESGRLPIHRPALHAWMLTVTHPVTGEPLSCQAPYPEDFAQALKTLRAKG
jgi:tRNA pseudouridine32 synthase / 23S rRNA pseudouridine746 synthase